MNLVRRSGSRAPLRRAVLIALAVAGIASLVLVTQTRAGVTQAAWVDSEYATATVSAAVIAPPEITSCSLAPGFLGLSPTVTLKWKFPAGGGYSTPSNVAYAVAEGGLLGTVTSVLLGSALTTTGPSAGVYTTKFESGILGGLLGGSYGIFVQTVDGSWTSQRAGATASMGLGGSGAQCTI
ncbi:hypothetical protein [Salinibacterium sp. SWN1162]|uniref:hypothetical protein n=1 Tax=Salinibacterium sp. SWN1162 TaxID=2792053 RepID=UPI0018CCB63A|nr:hypothetical protein [Salinibacterium sp. SWN1162]MBH0007833.1 hypothetical protein [Salinibacterium sp. SWN1162]